LPTNRPAIERATAKDPMPNVHWVYFDTPAFISNVVYKSKRAERVHYNLWQMWVYPFARKLHKEVGFDVVQHITYVQYWTASFLVLLDAAFIWGPVAGGESAPKSFMPSFSEKGQRYERIRDIGRMLGHLHPVVHMDARRCEVAIPATVETERQVLKLGAKKTVILQGAALSRQDFDMLTQFPIRTEGPVRFVSIGRLLHWKGFHLGIRAFAELVKDPDVPECEYWIVGDGNEMASYKQLAADLGVGDKVTFTGLVPRSEVLERLAECDSIVHPSLHEAGGWVTLEAAAAGRPVICMALGGPGAQVTPESGFAIPAQNPEQAVRAITAAMKRIATEPDLKHRMAAAGRKRVEEKFLWDRVGEVLADLPPYQT
jgi:glycosyltransferase involved in cell wall biosynthesis